MAFSRNNLLAAVAGSVSVAMLAGCPGAPTGPSPSPTVAPTVAPTTEPTTDPTAEPSASATQPGSNLGNTTLRGQVFDEKGALITSGARVTAKSLNPSNPFEQTVDVLNGAYVFNEIPAGVQLELKAFRDNYTNRTRVETLLPLSSAQSQIVNFGGRRVDTDIIGPAYFLSDYPEVESVTPAHEATNVDSDKISVVLTLSEPLSETNRRRFAEALRVGYVPTRGYTDGVNDSQIGGTVDTDTSTEFDADDIARSTLSRSTPIGAGLGGDPTLSDADVTAMRYHDPARLGLQFLGDSANSSSVTWDAEGKVATFTYNVPFVTSNADESRYQVYLISDTNGSVILDGQNKGLGGAPAAEFKWVTGTYGNTQPIVKAFKSNRLAISKQEHEATGAKAWDHTHLNGVIFSVARDEAQPQVASVSVVGNNRLDITFSEPMVSLRNVVDDVIDIAGNPLTAYHSITSAVNLANYTFKVSGTQNASVSTWVSASTAADGSAAKEGGTETIQLVGKASASVAAGPTSVELRDAKNTATVYTFSSDAFMLRPSVTDPKVIRIFPKPGLENDVKGFDSSLRSIILKVNPTVTDNASNTMDTGGDKNYVSGAI